MAEEASKRGVQNQNQVDERLTTLKLEIDEINLTRDPSNDKEDDAQNTLCEELDPQTLFADIFEQLKELEEKVSKCLQNQDLLLHVVRRVTSLEDNFEQLRKDDSKKNNVKVTEVPPMGNSNSRLQRRSSSDPPLNVNNHDQMEREGSESSDSDPSDSDNNGDNDWQPHHSDSEPDLDNYQVKTRRSSNRTTSKQRTENNVENVDVDLLDSVTKVKVEDEDWQPSQSEDTDSENGLTDEMETEESNSTVRPPKPKSEAHSGQSKVYKCGLCPVVFPEKHVMDRHHFIHAAGLEFRCFCCNIQFGSLEDLNEHNHSMMHGENKTCTTCKKVFRRPRDIMSHLRNVHGINRPYNCVRCKRSFKERGDLLNHEIKHHGGRKIYENDATTQENENELSGRPFSQVENAILNCKICSAKLQNTQKLYRHYRTQHLDFLSAYKCKICEDAFFNAELLAHHYSERHPVITDRTPSTVPADQVITVISDPTSHSSASADPSEFRCSECKELLTSQQSLTEHLRTVHGLGIYVRCSLCQTCFARRDKVKAHLFEVHGQSGKLKNVEYPCQRCNKCFQEKNLFNLHVPGCLGLGLKRFHCDVCGVGFTRKYAFVMHKRHKHSRAGEELVLCPEPGCGKQVRKHTLKHHLRSHETTPAHICEICGRPYARKIYLKAHMQTHTGEKSLSCTYCDKKFSHEYSLKKHLSTHTTGKNHSCTICGKAFRLKSSLKRHENIHTGEKPFVCELCGKRFTQGMTLKRHMRIHEREGRE